MSVLTVFSTFPCKIVKFPTRGNNFLDQILTSTRVLLGEERLLWDRINYKQIIPKKVILFFPKEPSEVCFLFFSDFLKVFGRTQ